MNYQVCYPNGKIKALTFSYDDGQIYDRRLIEIFNRFGMKATFHLNSGILGGQDFVTKEEVASLYAGHEIACHGVSHPYFSHLSQDQLVQEVWEDRRALEKLAGYPVRGMSYPYGNYTDSVAISLRNLGIEYSRTVCSENQFNIPDDFMKWHPTCHHNSDILKKADDFFNLPNYSQLALFYIWGHSFEFERQNNWKIIDNFCEKAAFKDDIWYATNLEIARYICAVRALVSDVESRFLYNPSAITVWIIINNKLVSIEPNHTIKL